MLLNNKVWRFYAVNSVFAKINLIFRRNSVSIFALNVQKTYEICIKHKYSVTYSYLHSIYHMLIIEELIIIFFGLISMLLLLFVGLFLTLKSRLFQIRGIGFINRHTFCTLFHKDKAGTGISPFQALTTALAGTMGVGNISGVATALVAGGPGAIAWMWISALLGMATKYAEIFLAVKYRRVKNGNVVGGAMYYIEYGLGKKWLAAVFALLCALCSLGIGNLAQVHSIAGVMRQSFGVPPLLCGIVTAVFCAIVICGGLKRIAKVTELVIPLLSIVYLFFCITMLWLNRTFVPSALMQIIIGAFGLQEAAGGVLGYGVMQAMHFGLSRGVFTNEAGLGSAPIAHASANCSEPSHQAAWGVFEVFLDTILVCTITALVILCAGGGGLLHSGLNGAPLTSAAFESAFPGIGAAFLAVAIAFFAFAAITGWYFYGESALRYLFKGERAVNFYRMLFLLCVVVGALANLEVVWRVSDILNVLMAMPNCIALLLLNHHIKWGESQTNEIIDNRNYTYANRRLKT